MDKEKLILQLMAEAEKDGEPITREEAEEMAEWEIKAKGIKNYVSAEVEKKAKKPKERKVDTEKKAILEEVAETLKSMGFEPTMENEVALHFDNFTLKLTKHRPPKKQAVTTKKGRYCPMKKLTFAETPKTRAEFVKAWNSNHVFRARAEYTGFKVLFENVILPNGKVADAKVRQPRLTSATSSVGRALDF